MIKKYLLLLLSFAFFSSFVYASNIINITSSWDIQLKDGLNTLHWWNIKFYKDNNPFLGDTIYNWSPDKIKITCENGYIIEINWYTTSSSSASRNWSWYDTLLEKAVVTYSDSFGMPPWDWSIDMSSHNNINIWYVSCIKKLKPDVVLVKNDLNYNTIDSKWWFWESFAISRNEWVVSKDNVLSDFIASSDKGNQSTFTDILYLQLNIIWNLTDLLLTSKKDFEIKKLFKHGKYSQYLKWLNKFWKFNSKKDFEDSFTGSVSLKDIWLAQDIILWMYSCLNDNNCDAEIDFKNINNKLDVYTLKDLEKKLYGDTVSKTYSAASFSKSLLDEGLWYYNKFSNSCNNLNIISDTLLRKQVENVCDKLLQNSIKNIEDIEYLNLGYLLGQRIININTIKNNIWPNWLNLKWIYNLYWELNWFNLWVKKLSIIEKIKSAKSEKQWYYLYNQMNNLNVKEIKKWIISNAKEWYKLIAINLLITKILNMITSMPCWDMFVSMFSSINFFDMANYNVVYKSNEVTVSLNMPMMPMFSLSYTYKF